MLLPKRVREPGIVFWEVLLKRHQFISSKHRCVSIKAIRVCFVLEVHHIAYGVRHAAIVTEFIFEKFPIEDGIVEGLADSTSKFRSFEHQHLKEHCDICQNEQNGCLENTQDAMLGLD